MSTKQLDNTCRELHSIDGCVVFLLDDRHLILTGEQARVRIGTVPKRDEFVADESRPLLRLPDQRHELSSSRLGGAERAEHRGGDHQRLVFLDVTQASPSDPHFP
jgi:hypothetical protein